MPKTKYVIHLVADSDDRDRIRRGINWILKRAGRNYGLKCVYVADQPDEVFVTTTEDHAHDR